jgi:hypothetical protein
MGIRRWLRRIERDARESADTCVLLDERTGEEFEVPKDVFLHVMGAFAGDEPDPKIAQILDRLDRLVYRDSGQPFWVEDMTHTGKTAANEK